MPTRSISGRTRTQYSLPATIGLASLEMSCGFGYGFAAVLRSAPSGVHDGMAV